MFYLLLAVLFTAWLLVAFRVFARWGTDNFTVIVINYWVCVLTGLLFPGNLTLLSTQSQWKPWMWMALATGACFLPTFFLMSYTVKKVSVTVATLANKTSLVLPVLVSVLLLRPGNPVGMGLWIGLLIGLAAIVLSSIQEENEQKGNSWQRIVLPLAVFLGGALVDILINISNAWFIPAQASSLFPVFAFFSSAFTGALVLVCLPEKWMEFKKTKTWLAGLVLGIPNFLSILFLLQALEAFNNNGAVVFPVLNMAVIVVNALAGIFVFKEKPGKWLPAALVLSVIALILVLTNG
ncbi:MAG: EamA family transporter [Cytophagaceae bacterium]|jgi:drug/metabolite transporter (DMT)-like permease|nr:EamA family transporter [Cytophagaceae bacterium]